MKCQICRGEILDTNSIVCSDKCNRVRLQMYTIQDKYTPCNGCENCLSDLHQGCTDQCKEEFRVAGEFGKDMWSIIRIIYPRS